PSAAAATGSCDIAVIDTPVRLLRNQSAMAKITTVVTATAITLDTVSDTTPMLTRAEPHGSPIPTLSVTNEAASTARIKMPRPSVPIITASCEYLLSLRMTNHSNNTMKAAVPQIASTTANPKVIPNRPGPNQ